MEPIISLKKCEPPCQSSFEIAFKTLSFTVARKWRQCRYPSTGKRVRKTWHKHTIKYYSVVKKSKIMNFAGSWVEAGRKADNPKEKDLYIYLKSYMEVYY